MSQPAAALYIQPPMFETTVAIQSIANVRCRNAASGDGPVAGFSTSIAWVYLAPPEASSTIVKIERA